MANYRAIASGNWSAGATWGGGAVPPNGAGHSIYSNTFTITIDTNVDVALITNAANAGTFVGGGTAAIGGSFTINNGIYVTSSTINSANALTSLINISGTASATITGNVTVASTSTATGITHSSSGTLTFTGNSTGAAGNTFSVGIVNSGNGNIIVTGNMTGGGANANFGINNTSTGTISITGLCTGGTASGAQAVNNASTGAVSITGNVIAGSGTAGANNASIGAFTVIGDITATNGANGFTSSNASATNRLSGSFISSANGTMAIYAVKYILNTTPLNAKTRYSLNGISTYVDMFTADNNLSQANPTDVRNGVSYASGSLIGTLTIPSEGTVANGVTVGPLMPFTATRSGTTATATLAYSYPYLSGDTIVVTGASNPEWNGTYTIASVISGTSITFNVPISYSSTSGTGAQMQTVGTAMLTAASIFNTLTSTMTTPGSIGERLVNTSTVAITGQQITNAWG